MISLNAPSLFIAVIWFCKSVSMISLSILTLNKFRWLLRNHFKCFLNVKLTHDSTQNWLYDRNASGKIVGMGVGINWGKQFCICLCPCDSHYHIWTPKSNYSVSSVGLIYPEKDKSLKDTGSWGPLVSSSVPVKGHIHSDVSIHILYMSIDRQTNALLVRNYMNLRQAAVLHWLFDPTNHIITQINYHSDIKLI